VALKSAISDLLLLVAALPNSPRGLEQRPIAFQRYDSPLVANALTTDVKFNECRRQELSEKVTNYTTFGALWDNDLLSQS
jgi:hypothetical protein